MIFTIVEVQVLSLALEMREKDLLASPQKNATLRAGMKWYFAVLIFVLGALVGIGGAYFYDREKLVSVGILEDRLSGYKYISPLLECRETEPLPIANLSKLEEKVQGIIAGYNNQDIRASIYVRDLSNGGWIQVENNELYFPASLMKLPIAIAVLKASETNPELLNQTLSTAETEGITQNIVTDALLPTGVQTMVSDLLRRSIENSDNNANTTLSEFIGVDAVQKVLDDVGVQRLTTIDDYKINPLIYSRFLRVLYNGTYLSQNNSEKLLSYMANSEYDSGLVQGIPPSVAIANKFGERVTQVNGETVHQLHDCGIVYAVHPYIICVMTEGDSFEQLSSLIGDISRTVYQAMDDSQK